MKAVPAFGAAAALALTVSAIFFADGYQLYIIALLGLTAVVGVGLNVILEPDRADLPRPRRLLRHRRLCRLDPHRDLRLELLARLSPGGGGCRAAGVLLAIPALRVTGPYLAMVTIAFGFVVEQGAAEWKEVTGAGTGS